jgi:hypothetical protein
LKQEYEHAKKQTFSDSLRIADLHSAAKQLRHISSQFRIRVALELTERVWTQEKVGIGEACPHSEPWKAKPIRRAKVANNRSSLD